MKKILNNINPKVFQLFKMLLSIVGVIYIIWQIHNHLSGCEIPVLLSNTNNVFLFIVAFILMPVNWFAESYKWQLLVNPIENIGFKAAVFAVLSGLAVAMFTPNRSGDFAGRILMLSPGKRGKGVLATWIGNIAQIVCTILFGIIGGAVILNISNNLPKKWIFNKMGLIVALSSLLVCIMLYWFVAKRSNNVFKNKRIRQFLFFTKRYTNKVLSYVLVISLFRYIVFSTQFYLILIMVGVDISFFNAYISVFTIYGIMLFLPVITLFEYPVRGSISIMVLSLFTNNVTQVAVASLLLWIINLGLPAIAGAVLWNKVRK